MAPLRSLLWYALDNREKFGTRHPDVRRADAGRHAVPRRAGVAGRRRRDQHAADRRPRSRRAPGSTTSGCCPSLFEKVELDPERTYAAVVGPPVVYKFVLAELLDS